jgi:uncharacterized membrane protein YedE/YeeE
MNRDSVARLAFGLITGVAFGALLQRARVSRYPVILGQLQQRDWTVTKVMGTAIAVGATGMHALASEGRGELQSKPLHLGGVVGGGILFGTGLTLLGYCPGTALAAIGEGRRDALVGALGMLSGAALFVRFYPKLKPLISAAELGKPTLPSATKLPAWFWIVALDSALGFAIFREFSAKRTPRRLVWR